MRLKFTTMMPLDIGDVTNAFILVALGLTYQGNFVEYIFSNKHPNIPIYGFIYTENVFYLLLPLTSCKKTAKNC